MSFKNTVQSIVGLCISAFFIWLITKKIYLADIGNALMQAQLMWVTIGIMSFLLGYGCRIWRWRLMLILDNPNLSWKRCSVPFMVSIAANNVLPLRAGDVLRVFGFSNWLNVPAVSVLATLLVERLLDLLALLFFFGIALKILNMGEGVTQTLLGTSATMLILIAMFIIAILLFPQFLEPVIQRIMRLIGLAFPTFAEKFTLKITQLFQTLNKLAQGPRLLALLFWSLLVWGGEVGVFFSLANAIPDISNPLVAWLAMPVGTLSTLLPSSPGYIGTFHYFVISATQLMGNSYAAAGAFAVLVHLVLWLSATVWGGFCFLFWVLIRPKTHPKKATSE